MTWLEREKERNESERDEEKCVWCVCQREKEVSERKSDERKRNATKSIKLET